MFWRCVGPVTWWAYFIWSLIIIITKWVVVIRNASGLVCHLVLLDPTRRDLASWLRTHNDLVFSGRYVCGIVSELSKATFDQRTYCRPSNSRENIAVAASVSAAGAAIPLVTVLKRQWGPTGLNHQGSRSGTFPAWRCRDVNDARAATHFDSLRSFASASFGGGKIRESSFLTGTSRA